MRNMTVTCDVCGKTKQKTNRWFQFLVNPTDERAVIFFGECDSEHAIDICGEECLHNAISGMINELTRRGVIKK